MNTPLRSWSYFLPGLLAVVLALAASRAAAQCPLAATCKPGGASNPLAVAFNMGILNVTVGSDLVNKTSLGQADGYQDYSCAENAALVVGRRYAISVRTNPNAPENVRAWIDYNGDGTFGGPDELIFSSDNQTLHTGTFLPPASAVLGTRLRLRVAADYVNAKVPTPCSTPEYSQDEDYSVTLAANVSAPLAAFTTSATTTCTGCVLFADASQNLPTAWLWTFGDGTTSTVRNPSHCYSTAGTYAVTLQATNAAGTNTSAATSLVYNSSVPVAASCAPQTINYFANYGITRFRLGTIDNRSANGSAGYEDFTCAQRTELTVGVTYPMGITTGGANRHDIQVYVDGNNDGMLTTAELVFQNLNTASPGASTILNLPAGTVLNQPLRLRVVVDAVGNNLGPCTRPVSGQVEDYTVVARANALPPLVNFSSDYVAGSCVNPIQFTDLSNNLPTAWLWTFGDGTTSTEQNPSHRYAATGSYDVGLSVTNAYGTATLTRPKAVTVSVPCLTYCAANGTGGGGTGGTQQPSPFFITAVYVYIPNVQPGFSNVTTNSPTGYANYTARVIPVSAGSQPTISVVSNGVASHRTAVWVDWNANSVFEASELVVDGVNASGSPTATFTASFAVPVGASGAARMRVISVLNTNAASPCAVNLLNAEVEDYELRVLPVATATRDATALPGLSLYPTPSPDGHLRLRLTDAQAAGIYTTEVQNLLGATLLTGVLRLGPTADAGLDLSTLAPGVYVLRLRDAHGRTVLRRVVRG